ncbi:MAG: metallophosphoesterase [Myxococcota bacterium]|nr:metallophosphoesterase [Myxococcota bacterium]
MRHATPDLDALAERWAVGARLVHQRRDPRRSFAIRRFAGPLDHLGKVGHLRVAHLTDLHVGAVTPLAVQFAAVELTNAANPDLVVLTGDFVCHSQLYLADLEEVVRGFRAPVFAVLGNHDHWSGASAVRRSLRRAGAEVLDNAHTVVELHHERLQIVGLDDAYTGHAWRPRAVRGLRRDLATIGLSHIAEEADGLWAAGVPLVLSGHTHAGQVTLARLHEQLVGRVAGHRYVHGLYGRRRPERPGEGAVYVGAGVGAAVMPLRLGERARREIAIFELGHEPGRYEEHHAEQRPMPGRRPAPRTQYARAAHVVRREARRRARTGSTAPEEPEP